MNSVGSELWRQRFAQRPIRSDGVDDLSALQAAVARAQNARWRRILAGSVLSSGDASCRRQQPSSAPRRFKRSSMLGEAIEPSDWPRLATTCPLPPLRPNSRPPGRLTPRRMFSSPEPLPPPNTDRPPASPSLLGTLAWTVPSRHSLDTGRTSKMKSSHRDLTRHRSKSGRAKLASTS
jgi:hypothetical protein